MANLSQVLDKSNSSSASLRTNPSQVKSNPECKSGSKFFGGLCANMNSLAVSLFSFPSFFTCLVCFRYYRFNEESQSVDDGYPKAVSVWQGVPDNIKAAFMSKDQGKGLCVCVCFAFL